MPWLDSTRQDLRYAIRSLSAAPLFTTIAVLTLAIGAGATTAIFSSVNAMLLRPLPFPHPSELISVRTRFPDGRVTSGMLSPVEIGALNDPHLPILRAAGYSSNAQDATLLRDDGTPVQILLTGVTQGFFEVLGLPMALGPGFTPPDFIPPAPNVPIAHTTVIVSYRFWTRMFGRDPSVIGRPIHIAELPAATIAAVASPDMDLPTGTDFWFAIRVDPNGIGHGFGGLLRMRPNTTIRALRSASAAAMDNLGRSIPVDAGREYVMQPLLDSIVGDLRPTLLIVLGATALLLLLACVNVTDLLLARGAARTRELAMRAALGATRTRLIRQLLTEALVLACAGALLGLALAYSGVRLLLVLGASKLPRLTAIPFDSRVLLFALAVLLFSALAMGSAPAWKLARADIRVLLNEGGRSSSQARGASRSMSILIVAEIALAIILAAGAGWLVQSFSRLQSVDAGFHPAGRLVVHVKSIRRFPDPAQGHTWWDTLLNKVRDTPGVHSAGAGATFPLGPDRDGTLIIAMQGELPDPHRPKGAHQRMVTAGFFESMGIRLRAGRDFTADDRQSTLPVAIVNQAFVRAFLGSRNPINTQFIYGLPDPDPKTLHTIVGVVDDVRYASLSQDPDPMYYLVEDQFPFVMNQQPVIVETRAGDPRSLIPGIQSALTAFDPQLVLTFETAPEIVAETLSRQKLGMTLMLIFGALALAMSAIGIYGIIAYASAQRRMELATRIALGASSTHVFWLVMSSGQRLALLGIAAGLAGAYAGGRIVSTSVYSMSASDPLILASAALLVAAIAFLATMIPALWASRLDPIRALRAD